MPDFLDHHCTECGKHIDDCECIPVITGDARFLSVAQMRHENFQKYLDIQRYARRRGLKKGEKQAVRMQMHEIKEEVEGL